MLRSLLILQSQSSIKRQVGNSNALEQIAHFTSGHVEITYVRHDNDLKLVMIQYMNFFLKKKMKNIFNILELSSYTKWHNGRPTIQEKQLFRSVR